MDASWLGYQWGTNEPALLLDLVRLEEPLFGKECWLTSKARGYKDASIMVAADTVLLDAAPDVVDFLRNWAFNIEAYKTVTAWQQDNPDADINDATRW